MRQQLDGEWLGGGGWLWLAGWAGGCLMAAAGHELGDLLCCRATIQAGVWVGGVWTAQAIPTLGTLPCPLCLGIGAHPAHSPGLLPAACCLCLARRRCLAQLGLPRKWGSGRVSGLGLPATLATLSLSAVHGSGCSLM